MARGTIIEDYVLAAMKRAQYDESEGGGVMASVPGFGFLTSGDDLHEAATDLYARLQAWVRNAISRGFELPALDGIDLNSNRANLLTTYRAAVEPEPEEEFYEDEKAMEEAFAEHDVNRERRRATADRKSRASRSASK